MRVKKTRQDQRGVYRYPVDVPDGKGGYRRTYNVIKPGEDGVTEVMIQDLHRMDDNEVTNNVRNGHPKLTAEQKAAKKEWEEAHPGEKYPMDWNLSLNYIVEGCEDGDVSKSSVLASASYDPFEDMDVPDEVLKMREIAANKMTDRQRQAYDFEMPAILEDTEIAAILPRIDSLTAWAADLKEYALQQALSGTHYDGFKVVEGRSNRKYSDEAAVASAAKTAGYDPYEKKLLGITALLIMTKTSR